MDDDHMHGLARLTALRSLCITGCADELTDEGMGTISGLSQVRPDLEKHAATVEFGPGMLTTVGGWTYGMPL